MLKMLAVSSTHSKIQISLSTEKALSLLVSCISEAAEENVMNALITIANIAQKVTSHEKVCGYLCLHGTYRVIISTRNNTLETFRNNK